MTAVEQAAIAEQDRIIARNEAQHALWLSQRKATGEK
jgi:hypothetical protein